MFDDLTALTWLSLEQNSLTELPDEVFDDLTALTFLNLRNNGELTELPDGVFDNLTSLRRLLLRGNGMTELVDGMFDNLTALTWLHLAVNELTELPDGVFDNLTALITLNLSDNELTELPDEVFDNLTALRDLNLARNPGAPFAPTADALPDDGKVPVAGGTVTLDGSGSGGAWGTNVTYSWALTNPPSGVTVTFDDAASAMPMVTIPALTTGTELTFTLTVTGRGTTSSLSEGSGAPGTDTATVTVSPAGTLVLTLDTIAGDDTVNIAEKAAGFSIGGATGTESGVSVTVTVGTTELTATSASGGAWSVDVPAGASYLTGTSVAVTVSASKTGYTPPGDVTRALAVDLTAPSATYTAPSSLQVGVAVGAMTPSTTDTDIASYGATGLPPGLGIDSRHRASISGTPDTADANTADATVTVTDTAGNTDTVDITFPAVAKGDQTLTGFAYSPAYGDLWRHRPGGDGAGRGADHPGVLGHAGHGVHGGRVHRRPDPGGGGRLHDYRHRGRRRRLQRGHRGVHRHGGGGRGAGADPRHHCRGRHGEHRREGGGVRDLGRHRFGGGCECHRDGGHDGADGDLGRRRGLVGGRAGPGLPTSPAPAWR